jgi:DNA-binding transcriptional regulator YiaG
VWKWEKGRVDPPKSALLCTLFLKIIRTIANDDLKLATYPPDQREAIMKLTQGDEELLQIKNELLRIQTKRIQRKVSKMKD